MTAKDRVIKYLDGSLLALALLSLLVGTAMYIWQRPAGSTYLHRWLAQMGLRDWLEQQAYAWGWLEHLPYPYSLPTFCHNFAFSLFSYLVSREILASCLLWLAINVFFEFWQRRGRGVFDLSDLVAALISALLAFITLQLATRVRMWLESQNLGGKL